MQLWSGKVQDPVPVHDDLTHLAFDVIGQAAFGYNFNTVLGGASKVSEAVNIVTGGMSIRYMIYKSLIPFFELLPIGETRRIKEAREIADNTVLEVSTVRPLLSGHPRDFEKWPLTSGWPLNRGTI